MKKREKRALDRMPLLWKHMLMMACILVLALTALGISNRQSVDTLTREHLQKFQISLDRDCAKLSSAMYQTIAIPDGVEGTRYYEYIKGVTDGVLDSKYYPVLNYLREALGNQIYLRGDSLVCLLYISGTNSIVSVNRNFPLAEDCFRDQVSFFETGTETIMGYLRERGSVTFLPVQPVKIDAQGYTPCLSLIIHPSGADTAVMSIYSQTMLLEYLGFSYLPEGSRIKLTEEGGQVLLQYPQEDAGEDCYRLTGTLKDFKIQAELWIPEDYFSDLLRPVRLTGLGSMALVTLMGLLLSYFLSKASVRPIRRLLSDHSQGEETPEPNEITRLDRLLRNSKEQSRDLQGRLLRQLLARALSGAVLSQREENFLVKELGELSENYQVAILYGSRQINPVLQDHLQQTLEGIAVTTLNDKETGLLLRGGDENLEKLTEAVAQLNELPDAALHCGISAPAERLEALHIAVRQARMALPQDQGVRLFPGESARSGSVSWLQHERLYQSVFSGEEQEALRLLRSIASQTDHGNAREAYYNVRFVLRSAAEELEMSLEGDRDYAQNLLPKENILSLEAQLSALFRGLEERKQEDIRSLHSRVLSWIRQNLADYELSAPTVGEKFGLPEKRVYEIVKGETGMTFREYLTSLRMKKAARLLRETGDGIGDIAQSCGYHGSSTFYRNFQEYYGMSPGQYRKEDEGE